MPVMVQREVILKAASILGKSTEIMKGQMKFCYFQNLFTDMQWSFSRDMRLCLPLFVFSYLAESLGID